MRAATFATVGDQFKVASDGQMTINNASPTIAFQDTDNRSAFLHCNSNQFYILRGAGANSAMGAWTALPSGYWPLQVSLENGDMFNGGSVYALGNVTAYYSDRRLKCDFAPITDAIAKVKAINGVHYRANELAETFGYDRSEAQVGLIAQEVQAVLPEAVTLAPFDRADDGRSKSGETYLTIKHDKLVPLLVEALKSAVARLEIAEAKIAELEHALAS
jgi:hypothetical protein